MSHDAFMQTIREAPDEDAARLVYADYLDEQGNAADSARAEFIRLQIRLAGMDEADRGRDALEDRENEILRKYEQQWFGPLPKPLAKGLVEWKFDRGFVGSITTNPNTLHSHGDELFDRHPISRVHIEGDTADDSIQVSQLAKRSWWSRVRDFNVSEPSGSTSPVCEPLLRSPHLNKLRRLSVSPNEGAEAITLLPLNLTKCRSLAGLEEIHIADWPHDVKLLLPVLEKAEALRVLRINGGTYTAKSLAALLASAPAQRGCRFELADGNLGGELWPAFSAKKVKPVLGRLSFTNLGRGTELDLPTLLSSPAAAKLDALDASETNLPATKVRAIASSGFMERATELGLTRCRVPVKVLAALAKTEAPHLRTLKLGEVDLHTEGVEVLCAAVWADALTHLDIMRNHLDDKALVALANSGRFTNVRYLDLRVNSPDLGAACKDAIGDKGVIALANAPNFARLRHLNLYRTRVTVKGVEAILNSPHWNVTELELGGDYSLGDDLVRVLATSPRLARMTKLGLSFTPSLGGDALMPLAESPHLSPLCHLDIRYNNPSQRVRKKLAERIGRRLEDNPAVDAE